MGNPISQDLVRGQLVPLITKPRTRGAFFMEKTMGPDFDALERNQDNWRMEGRKSRFLRILKLYGIATAVLISAAVFAVAELSPLLK